MHNKIAMQWKDVSFSVRHGFLMKNRAILRNINLNVSKGSVLGLVGPNGAGKTTTLKLGAGLLAPDCGSVLINGKNATDKMARTFLGLLTETQYIYPHMQLKEWLIMLAGLSGISGRSSRHRADEMLAEVELVKQKNQMMHTLSKGQLQRAGLAQALLHDPDILLLDEPMSGLDPYWRYKILNILIEYKKKGGTIVFSSHILGDVETLSDKVALLQKGKIIWSGRLKELDRKVAGYKIICYTSAPEIIEKIADGNKIEKQPDGAWFFLIQPDKKPEFLNLVASNDEIKIESLLPIQEELASVLFRTTVSP